MSERPVVFLHIGTVKTGSTFVQKAFYQNASVFERFGVSYPYVFPPTLRYANAEFLFDRSRDTKAKNVLSAQQSRIIFISEEGIFNEIDRLKHPALNDLPKKLMLYVRRPAELICSWAAENAQPYNAFSFLKNHRGDRPLPVADALSILSDRYEQSIRNFINVVDEIGQENIIVRPFEPSAYTHLRVEDAGGRTCSRSMT